MRQVNPRGIIWIMLQPNWNDLLGKEKTVSPVTNSFTWQPTMIINDSLNVVHFS